MGEVRTNRDLYVAIGELVGRHREKCPALEEYLRSLWNLVCGHRTHTSLPVSKFFKLLSEAFLTAPTPFDESWAQHYADDYSHFDGFRGWEARITRQLVDLHEMDACGTLSNKLRYFGINSPRGERWFNFDPCTFLECAVAGSFGGWREGDSTGREYVPGPVAVLGDDGTIKSVDPRDVTLDTFPIAAVSWETFRDFLGAGQWYE